MAATLLALWVGTEPLAGADSPQGPKAPANTLDYGEPKLLTGTIYEPGSNPPKVLFKFRRTATRSGSTIRVLREYNDPDGTPAARERVVYEADKLATYELEELQIDGKGSATRRKDPKTDKEKICFEYIKGRAPGAKKQVSNEALQKDALLNDTIAPFLAGHWEALMHGQPVKFRYIVIPRTETVGFKLVKESETTWQGKPAVRIKMEPTSVVIAALVDPLFFTVEKEGEHRVLEYAGRTTPKIKVGNKWKDLDALTVFDWK
ncbi:MAG: hypothetical protein HYY24_24475 [Verrucomicrobia bacterium]|nr:hypothetical protein [Verrucomicrobiota bacterium]